MGWLKDTIALAIVKEADVEVDYIHSKDSEKENEMSQVGEEDSVRISGWMVRYVFNQCAVALREEKKTGGIGRPSGYSRMFVVKNSSEQKAGKVCVERGREYYFTEL